jgi:alpha-ketoglutarate-dependent taurine dioxygenase
MTLAYDHPQTAAPELSGLRALLSVLPVPVVLAHEALTEPVSSAHPLLLVCSEVPDGTTLDRLVDHLRGGGRALVAVSPESAPWMPLGPLVLPNASTLAAPDPHDPLVLDPHLRAGGSTGSTVDLAGLAIEADDFVGLRDGLGRPLAHADGHPVAVEVTIGEGTAVVLGSVAALTNRWIAAADNAVVVPRSLCPGVDVDAESRRAAQDHRPPPVHLDRGVIEADNAGDDRLVGLLPPNEVPVGSAPFVAAAARAGRLLSAPVHDALCDLVDLGAPSGALLVHDLPVGDVPATPPSPVAPTGKDHVSELVLLTVARRLGQPVGYAPEHGGDIVQNLLPTKADADRQTSTSSGVDLEFHTETAFHPHKPRYLLLLCLRGDEAAETRLCSITQVVEHLPLGVRQVLHEPRFRTTVDESFGRRDDGERRPLGPAVPVLSGPIDRPSSTFDADLMVGTDADAADALDALRAAIAREHLAVTLRTGDLLVIDNTVAVHGRSSFPARFDGTDRWIQRAFVVADLAPSATERRGRVITTRFA